jgi:hypothetical protein
MRRRTREDIRWAAVDGVAFVTLVAGMNRPATGNR